MSNNYFYEVLNELIEDLNRDFIETQQDELISYRREAFNKYYDVEEIKPVTNGLKYGFIDAGFIVYEFDVSIILPMRISAVIRDSKGELHRINDYLGRTVYDALLLYSARKTIGDRYSFKIRIEPFHDHGLLFDRREEARKVSNEINHLLDEVGNLTKTRSPSFFKKMTRYIEGLLELAYALKLCMELEDRGEDLDYVVLDGTLIKWFSVRKLPVRIDGLDILSIILSVDKRSLIKYLYRVIGLSKTSKFTNIVRSHSLFNAKKPCGVCGNGLYTRVDINGLRELEKLFNKLLSERALESFIEDTIHLFNRIVFHRHGVWVSRFPLTPDNYTVFMLDIYMDKPILVKEQSLVSYDRNNASLVNSRLDEIVNTLLAYRTRSIGEPPYGYMEVDKDVRLGRNIKRSFEIALLTILREREDYVSRILEQVFSSTTRMRYGYS
ncbi:MAG: hypothetical protein B6U89_04255 [Desulfurococcales archaeon ex4484_58]|nr:MAG: hypothetical protein B6U89_04255 [Desulfurococcales archaeon ex4484_58]